jgi:formamidopyrimidine-DNA glycosylase
LSSGFKLNEFEKIIFSSKRNIKTLLLDQSVVAGIGNIYADESLFASGIKPQRSSNSLSKEEIKKLRLSIIKILKKSIKYRGTSFSDYRDSYGEKGNFVKFLKVYGRSLKPCLKCGRILRKEKVAGRGTSWCDFCQK